jgi:NADPH-dependent 2,4-dienoyl-CoA reductase/sulfur reductase-like enzyme
MSSLFDLVVVGAGPGGMAAAATAAESGMRVCLIDDNPAPGGQIWRRGINANGTNSAANRWHQRLQQSHVEVRSGWRAVSASAATLSTPHLIRIEQDSQFTDIRSSSLILATGAKELFLPFPGWTLPGVYGAGGLQSFVKSGLDISSKRIVIAGTGPLLLAVAAHLHAAGARIAAIIEQAPLPRLAQFSLSLLRGHPGKLIEGAGYKLQTLGVPYRAGTWITSANGKDTLSSVTVSSGQRTFEIEAEMLAIGYHLVPNTELAQLLHCELEQGCVCVDTFQETTVKGVYCIGEATGIGGVEKAQIEGRIAALVVSGQIEQARNLAPARNRQIHFAHRLAQAFQLRDELRTLPRDETIVCRCEDVPHGALSACRSWREAKLHTRCGMGPCQGRICGPATQFIYGWNTPRPRPPLFPVHIATLAGIHASED